MKLGILTISAFNAVVKAVVAVIVVVCCETELSFICSLIVSLGC
jgi:hypothetical protein